MHYCNFEMGGKASQASKKVREISSLPRAHSYNLECTTAVLRSLHACFQLLTTGGTLMSCSQASDFAKTWVLLQDTTMDTLCAGSPVWQIHFGSGRGQARDVQHSGLVLGASLGSKRADPVHS